MLHRHANSPPTAPYMARKMSVCGSAARYVLGSWAAIGQAAPCRGVVGLPETTPRVPLSAISVWEIGPPCREFCGQNAHEKWGGGPVGQFWGHGRQSARRPLTKGPLGPPNPPSPHSQLPAWSGRSETAKLAPLRAHACTIAMHTCSHVYMLTCVHACILRCLHACSHAHMHAFFHPC